MSYLWKTEAEVSLEGLKNLEVLVNGTDGLWLENVDNVAKVGTGVDKVEVVLLVVVVDLEVANAPKRVRGVFVNVDVAKVGIC